MDVEKQIEIETTKEIICITACEYDVPESEWMTALQNLITEDETYCHLSESALAFLDDISIWARSEEIAHDVLAEAVRRIYEEC